MLRGRPVAILTGMAPDQANTPKPRRFFRYSLRTLMIVVTLFCMWLGIIEKRVSALCL